MKRSVLYISLGAVLLITLVVIVAGNRKPGFDGRVTLRRTDKIPYGCYTAFEALKKEFPKAGIEVNRVAPWEWNSKQADSPGQAMIIVNGYFDPSEKDLDHLTGFVQKGNTVLISVLDMNAIAQQFFQVKLKDIFSQTRLQSARADSMQVALDSNLFNPPHRFTYPGFPYASSFQTHNGKFTYRLGHDKDALPDLIAIRTGKGTLILHSAPAAFTNLFLLYDNNYQYYRNILSLFPADMRKIYWDEYFLYGKSENAAENEKGLLTVIFKYPPFKYAFWLMLILLALYIFTEAKRKQRMIETHSRPVNDSLNFVSTISNLYYDKGDHHNLAEKLTHLFLDYVRTRYKIPTQELNSSFEKLLSTRSSVPLAEIEELLSMVKYVQFEREITGKQLLQYYQLLENFYKQA